MLIRAIESKLEQEECSVWGWKYRDDQNSLFWRIAICCDFPKGESVSIHCILYKNNVCVSARTRRPTLHHSSGAVYLSSETWSLAGTMVSWLSRELPASISSVWDYRQTLPTRVFNLGSGSSYLPSKHLAYWGSPLYPPPPPPPHHVKNALFL